MKRIDLNKKDIEAAFAIWDKIPPDNINNVLFDLGLSAARVSLYYILLGEKAEALVWANTSADYYKRSIVDQKSRFGPQRVGVDGCLNLLNSAILSSNKNMIIESIELCRGIRQDFPEKYRDMAPFYYYIQAVGDILTENDTEAKTVVEHVNKGAPRNLKKYFEGLKVCLDGILSNDKDVFLAGLDKVLEDHKKVKTLGPPDEMLCVPAAVQIKLAELRGIKVTPEDVKEKYRPYIPWLLFE